MYEVSITFEKEHLKQLQYSCLPSPKGGKRYTHHKGVYSDLAVDLTPSFEYELSIIVLDLCLLTRHKMCLERKISTIIFLNKQVQLYRDCQFLSRTFVVSKALL